MLPNKWAKCHVIEGFTAQLLVGIGDEIVRGLRPAFIKLLMLEGNLEI